MTDSKQSPGTSETAPDERRGQRLSLPPGPLKRTIVLVGLMGAGKSAIGRRLANRLGVPFVDADSEIEKAAGQTVSEIFESHGEAAFRAGERRVIARLLEQPPHVLATGGGAFMDAETRRRIREVGCSVWLRADLDLLLRRVARRSDRPLLAAGDKRAILERLIAERYPVYAEADIVVDSEEGPHETMVERVLAAFERFERERGTERVSARGARA
jgi:shikimate kinase